MASSDQIAVDPKEQFFRYFQLEATALQNQMAKLSTLPVIGGERIDAMDHCLAGIARLQKEVQEASSYIPAYDQKIYTEGVKALNEKFDQTKATLQPKAKFAFKSSIKKNDSAISLNDAEELASQQKPKLYRDPGATPSSAGSSVAGTPDATPTLNENASRPAEPHRRGSLGQFLQAAGQKMPASNSNESSSSQIRRMSFTSANSVSISSHQGVHIILPSSASHATSSGSLTNLKGSIVDMSMPTETGKPFATLAIKNIQQSLLICGSVNGAAHITGVKHSVIVVAVRQFRMHDCSDCIVYLHANSQPIIEDCERISFAPIADRFKPKAEDLSEVANQWNQVQDFKWLKPVPSPSWSVLEEDRRLNDEQWQKITSTNVELSLKESLRVAGIRTT